MPSWIRIWGRTRKWSWYPICNFDLWPIGPPPSSLRITLAGRIPLLPLLGRGYSFSMASLKQGKGFRHPINLRTRWFFGTKTSVSRYHYCRPSKNWNCEYKPGETRVKTQQADFQSIRRPGILQQDVSEWIGQPCRQYVGVLDSLDNLCHAKVSESLTSQSLSKGHYELTSGFSCTSGDMILQEMGTTSYVPHHKCIYNWRSQRVHAR